LPVRGSIDGDKVGRAHFVIDENAVYNSSEYDSEYDDSLEAIDELPMAEDNDDNITPALSNRNVQITHGGGGESSRSKGVPS
jgi:hypothetical protein